MMTLKELGDQVNRLLKSKSNEDLIVCIPNGKPSMGGMSVTPVSHVSRGFDWNVNKFILFPEKDMMESDVKKSGGVVGASKPRWAKGHLIKEGAEEIRVKGKRIS